MDNKLSRRGFLRCLGFAGVAAALPSVPASGNISIPKDNKPQKRPNILICLSDDQSWLHTGAYGCKWVKTPAFDRIARQGVLFNHCFAASPSCSPSRASILTGRQIWQNGVAGVHYGLFPKESITYTDILSKAGYFVGGTGKLWGPGRIKASGLKHNPVAAKTYNKRKLVPPATGINKNDYAANFADFLNDKPDNTPFCFWLGSFEPHLNYEKGSGIKKGGKKLSDIDKVPGFLPDNDDVRTDLLDYAFEIEHFDNQMAKVLKTLEEKDQLNNTLIFVTSDNGMPFIGAKTQCYEYSLHMPLAVMWPDAIKPGRTIDDFVGFYDFAPTFLTAAGIKTPSQMSGRSFLDILTSGKTGWIDPKRDHVFAGKERHEICRENKLCYPIRALRTKKYLYLWNIKPDRQPCGPLWSGYEYFGGLDYAANAKNGDKPSMEVVERLSAKRPEEELFLVENDPCCLKNLAQDPKYADIKKQLRSQLESHLNKTEDPRILGNGDFFDSCPAFHPVLWKNKKKTPPTNYRFDRFNPAFNKDADKLNAEIEKNLKNK